MILRTSQASTTNKPAVFALPATPVDVQAVVKCANNANVSWAIRAGGHSYTAQSLLNNGLVIDVSSMLAININAAEGTMVVGAGQQLGPIYSALAAVGYYIPGGTCVGVGVSGLTLGGGNGYATRAAGITSDLVIGAKVGRSTASAGICIPCSLTYLVAIRCGTR
jgi:FAD/FMN-containing dehydrogenase